MTELAGCMSHFFWDNLIQICLIVKMIPYYPYLYLIRWCLISGWLYGTSLKTLTFLGGVRCWLHLVEMTWKWQKLGATRSTSTLGFFLHFVGILHPFWSRAEERGILYLQKTVKFNIDTQSRSKIPRAYANLLQVCTTFELDHLCFPHVQSVLNKSPRHLRSCRILVAWWASPMA